MTDANNPNFPVGRNEEARAKENEALHGADLSVECHLPDGKVEKFSVKGSTEVGYVKVLLSTVVGKSVKQIKFEHNGKLMLDPMSFIDHSGVTPPIAKVTVTYT
eukprot:Trichotokara_eunicae@DN3545_c0_g1_i2.p1